MWKKKEKLLTHRHIIIQHFINKTFKMDRNNNINSRSSEERMEDFTGVTDAGRRKITENKMGPTELMKSNWNHKKNE